MITEREVGMTDFVKGWLESEECRQDAILVRKAYIDICGGSYNAAALLAQLLYWSHPTRIRVKKIGVYWVAKRHKDWFDEIRLSEDQAQRAVRILKGRDLIETEVHKFNGEPTVHYRIKWQNFAECLPRYGSVIGEIATSEPLSCKHPVTETTTEITA